MSPRDVRHQPDPALHADAPAERWALFVLVALLAMFTIVFYWAARTHLSEMDATIAATACGAAVVGYGVSLVLLARPRGFPGSAAAAGIAFATAGPFLLGALAWVAIERATDHRGDESFNSVYKTLVAGCLLVLVVAMWHARRRRLRFLAGTAAGLGVLVLAGSIVGKVVNRGYADVQQVRLDGRVNEQRAIDAIFELTACALRAGADGKDRGFPDGLASIATGTACGGSPATSRSLAAYTLTYTARRDSGSSRVTDFQLVAVPDPGLEYAGPVVSDGRGLVFVMHRSPPNDPRSDSGARIVWRDRGLSFVIGYRNLIGEFIQQRAAGQAPATLDEIIATDTSSHIARYLVMTQRDTAFRIAYAPAGGAGSARFAVVVTCASFGIRCIRSYYMAPDGRVHATGEPRPATEDDPPIVDGENSDGVMNGVVGWGGR